MRIPAIIHSLETSAANKHDLNQAGHLLHGREFICYEDSDYQGIARRAAFQDKDLEWVRGASG